MFDEAGGGGNSTSYDADDVNISSAKGTIRGTPRQLFNLLSDPGERDNLLVDDPATRAELGEHYRYCIDQLWGTVYAEQAAAASMLVQLKEQEA